MLGFDDICNPHSVVLIEWADKVESVLRTLDYIRIELEHAGRGKRTIHIKNTPQYINEL
jgi:tRNA A37 threonylcarbamoyladenosine biosynthesis protein TsaE